MAVSPAELQRRIDRFMETFSRLGLKITHQRAEVFREVAGNDEHLDAEMIYQRVRTRVTGISRDTVYRALAVLESEGLLRRAGVLGGSAKFDANMDPHHHYVCTVCGAVKDFQSQHLDDLPIPGSVQALGSIQSTQVQVRGICSSCTSRQRKETTL